MGQAVVAVRRTWPLLALVVLVLVGLAVVTSVAGPAQFGAPRVAGIDGLGLPRVGQPGTGDGAAPSGQDEPARAALPGWSTVVWLLALCAALVLAVRAVARLLREADGGARGRAGEPTPAAGDAHLLAAVRQGLLDAERALDARAGHHRDAVIDCWLALEAAAARAGTRRDPAQTPSEFTAQVLVDHRADAVATDDLLALYHQARFGSRPLPAAAIAQARSALARVADSLEAGDG